MQVQQIELTPYQNLYPELKDMVVKDILYPYNPGSNKDTIDHNL
jgi:hypothetical protein